MLRGRNAKTGCLTLHASSSRSSSKVLDGKGRSYYCALVLHERAPGAMLVLCLFLSLM